MFYWVQQGGSPSVFVPFFCLLSIGGPANLCESVATECLSAAECSALQQPSPHPPTCSLVRCLPADPYKTGFPFFSSLPPLGLQAQSSSFRTGPPVLNLLLLLRQSLSSTTSNSSRSLSLFCKDHFSQRWMHLMCFFWFYLWNCRCAFLFCCHEVC